MEDDGQCASLEENVTEIGSLLVDTASEVQKDVVLVCPDHRTILADGIEALFREQYKSDLKITGAGGHTLHAHQFMLALFSPAFRQCFATNSDKEIDVQRLSMLEPLLQFVYSGQVSVPHSCLAALLKSARRLGVDLLVRAIESTQEQPEPSPPTPPPPMPPTTRHSDRLVNRPPADQKPATTLGARRRGTRSRPRPPTDEDASDVQTFDTELPPEELAKLDDTLFEEPFSESDDEPVSRPRRSGKLRRRGRPRGTVSAAGKRQAGSAPSEALSLQCPHCDYRAPSGKRRYLYVHLANAHKLDVSGQPLREKFACDDCGATFFFGKDLKLHAIKEHATEKPFRCQECNYSTVHKGSLTIHINIVHRNIRQYVCELCGHRSAHLSAFKCHSRTHSKLKPYVCDVCQKEFSDRYNFKLHVGRHVSDEKPFLCHLCSHSTRRRDNLRSHLARVHKAELPTQ